MFPSVQKDEEKQNVRQKLEKKREERSSGSSSPTDEEYEVITSAMVQEEMNSYRSMIKRKILTIDLSDHSTYIQLGIGGATGLLTGHMVGKVGKAMAAGIGGTILLINMGTRAGYITVDWEKVDADMRTASEQISEKIAEQQQNEETQELLKKGGLFIRRNLVMLGGFAAGFFLGMAT
ncbi:FUN14 domain-containing protein 2-like [Clytia hemisphaerica]